MDVFVYGSLMQEEVAAIILKRPPKRVAATLKGYHRYKIKGCVFPGIMRSESNEETVDGWVYTELTRDELNRMDAFEDEEYER